MNRWAVTLSLCTLTLFGAVLLLVFFSGAVTPDLVEFGIFFAVVLGVGVLTSRSETLDRALHTGIVSYLKYLLWLALALGPALVLHWFATRVVEGLPGFLQTGALVAWGVALAAGLLVIGRGESRRKFFARLERFGGLIPAVYSFNMLVISILFFASASHSLVDHGHLEFLPKGDRFPSNGALADFFLWHFMDSVPLLDVNETLRWEVPFDYRSARVGWILLLFKFAVIVPVVGAFRGYWKHLREGEAGKP